MPDPIVYEAPERVGPCTVKAVERCLQHGFCLDDIAIVSMRGRERSLLQRQDRLGCGHCATSPANLIRAARRSGLTGNC